MDYFLLSLPEAQSVYLGLALQMAVRQQILPGVVAALVAVNIVRLLYDNRDKASLFGPVLTYAVISLAFMGLFWPDAVRFGRSSQRQLGPEQIASYAASEDPGATLVTAADVRGYSRGVLDTVVGPVREISSVIQPLGFHWLLGLATEKPLQLAKLVNTQTHRPLTALVPMQWLMGMELTADLTRAAQDWLEACYKPSLLTDREFDDAITARQLLPWGNTPVAQALATREAIPGAQTGRGYFRRNTPLGVSFLSNPGSSSAVRCDVYLAAVEQDVQTWLFTTPSPAGIPLSAIFDAEFGLSMERQARMILWREMLRLMGGPVPAPSLAGSVAALGGTKAMTGALTGLLSGAAKPKGGSLGGALFGSGAAVVNQFEEVVSRLLWWVALAAWFVWWVPDIMGLLQLLLVGFAPVVYLWDLRPGHFGQALLPYFVTLLWACSSPLWFAIIDLYARSAVSRAAQSEDLILQTLNWAPAQMNWVVMTVIGLAVVPLVYGAILFGVLRGVQALWRGAQSAT